MFNNFFKNASQTVANLAVISQEWLDLLADYAAVHQFIKTV